MSKNVIQITEYDGFTGTRKEIEENFYFTNSGQFYSLKNIEEKGFRTVKAND